MSPDPEDDRHGSDIVPDRPAGPLAKTALAATPFLLALLAWWLLTRLS